MCQYFRISSTPPSVKMIRTSEKRKVKPVAAPSPRVSSYECCFIFRSCPYIRHSDVKLIETIFYFIISFGKKAFSFVHQFKNKIMLFHNLFGPTDNSKNGLLSLNVSLTF